MYPKEHVNYHPIRKIKVVKVSFDFDPNTAQKKQYDLLANENVLRASLNGFKGQGLLILKEKADAKKIAHEFGLKIIKEEERDYWELLNGTYLL